MSKMKKCWFFSHLFFLTFLGEISVKASNSFLWNFGRPEVMMGVDRFKVHLMISCCFFSYLIGMVKSLGSRIVNQ